MSNFSEKCRQYMEYNEMSVYHLSKISGLERTALHRMLKGSRLPSREFVEKFCSFLRISPYETRQLMESYYEESVGEAAYQKYSYIKVLLKHLAESEEEFFYNNLLSVSEYGNLKTAQLPPYASTSLQVQTLIYQVLCGCFSDPEPVPVYTNLPAGFEYFYSCLHLFYQQSTKEVPIYHLITFLANPATAPEASHNLKVLYHLLPLALSPCRGYMPFYTYCKCTDSDLRCLLWPYYIVTSSCVLELSPDLEQAIVYTDTDIIRLYRTRLEVMQKQLHPLIQSFQSEDSAIRFYQQYSDSSKHICTLEASPCTLSLIPFEQISSLVNSAYINEAIKAIAYSMFQSSLPTMNSNLFSEQGLSVFCRTGKLLGQIGAYFPALSIEARKACLAYCIKKTEEPDSCLRLIDLEAKVPLHIYIELSENRHLIFARINPELPLCFCVIQEATIVEAFLDFFRSAEEIGFVLSRKQTAQVIREYLGRL